MARDNLTGIVNFPAFDKSLGDSKGSMETLLKGHLWIENVLNSFLETAANQPDALHLDRASFSHKVNLCEAFGLVPPPVAETLRVFNRHRNKLAHSVEATFDDFSLEALISETRDPIRSSFDRLMAKQDPATSASSAFRLHSWVMIVVNILGYELLLFEYHRAYEPQHVAFAAARLLDERAGKPARPADEIRNLVGLPEPPRPENIWLDHESPGGA